jgi:hypothetical protein
VKDLADHFRRAGRPLVTARGFFRCKCSTVARTQIEPAPVEWGWTCVSHRTLTLLIDPRALLDLIEHPSRPGNGRCHAPGNARRSPRHGAHRLLRSTDESVGETGRFRKPIVWRGAGQDDLLRAGQVDPVTDTDEDRMDAVLRALERDPTAITSPSAHGMECANGR